MNVFNYTSSLAEVQINPIRERHLATYFYLKCIRSFLDDILNDFFLIISDLYRVITECILASHFTDIAEVYRSEFGP